MFSMQLQTPIHIVETCWTVCKYLFLVGGVSTWINKSNTKLKGLHSFDEMLKKLMFSQTALVVWMNWITQVLETFYVVDFLSLLIRFRMFTKTIGNLKSYWMVFYKIITQWSKKLRQKSVHLLHFMKSYLKAVHYQQIHYGSTHVGFWTRLVIFALNLRLLVVSALLPQISR